jgi:hypothetical protein
MSKLKSVYLYLFYRVYYDSKVKGYFVRKREITFILLGPILVPFFMLYGLILYVAWVASHRSAWTESPLRKLSFREKVNIINRLK